MKSKKQRNRREFSLRQLEAELRELPQPTPPRDLEGKLLGRIPNGASSRAPKIRGHWLPAASVVGAAAALALLFGFKDNLLLISKKTEPHIYLIQTSPEYILADTFKTTPHDVDPSYILPPEGVAPVPRQLDKPNTRRTP